MIKSLHISNFRCFKDFEIDGIQHVNLIAGRNNVGKTALLESLFISHGPTNLRLPLAVNVLRGAEYVNSQMEEIVAWLFLDCNTDLPIEFLLGQANERQSRLTIRLANTGKLTLENPSDDKSTRGGLHGQSSSSARGRELTLEYVDYHGTHRLARGYIEANQIKAEIEEELSAPECIILGSRSRTLDEDVARFNELGTSKLEQEVAENLRILEPRLRELTIRVHGGKNLIHGDIGLERRVPVPFMGEGTAQFLSILLAIVKAKGGAVLIDEIENGIHHEVLSRIWHAIADAAHRWNTQIFATTHSWECVCAAHEAFSNRDVYDFALHRLDRPNGDIRTVTYSQEALDAAITASFEVR